MIFRKQKQIERAALVLDELVPDWYQQISIRRLSMLNARQCVLGQLFGSYFSDEAHAVRSQVFDRVRTPPLVHPFVAYLHTSGSQRRCKALWTAEIEHRVAQAQEDYLGQFEGIDGAVAEWIRSGVYYSWLSDA